MTRYSLREATGIICDGADLKLPELWVSRRLRGGIFTGLKIGRDWFMTDADIESAIETCRRGHIPPDIPRSVEAEPAAAVSISDGLSERARRLRSA